jgi:hypothetical protein
MSSCVPGNLGRRRLPARPEGEACPRCSCLVGKNPGKSPVDSRQPGWGLEPGPVLLPIQGRRDGYRVTCDSCAPGRDRSCPPRTSGSRCRADLARTRATTTTAGSGPVWSRTPAALRSSATRDRSAGRARQGHHGDDPLSCHAVRLLLRRWPLFLAGRRGPSWATSGCEHADQPARDGGQDRGERVRHRDPVVDERGPGDGTDDEVQAKGRHDREIQPIG